MADNMPEYQPLLHAKHRHQHYRTDKQEHYYSHHSLDNSMTRRHNKDSDHSDSDSFHSTTDSDQSDSDYIYDTDDEDIIQAAAVVLHDNYKPRISDRFMYPEMHTYNQLNHYYHNLAQNITNDTCDQKRCSPRHRKSSSKEQCEQTICDNDTSLCETDDEDIRHAIFKVLHERQTSYGDSSDSDTDESRDSDSCDNHKQESPSHPGGASPTHLPCQNTGQWSHYHQHVDPGVSYSTDDSDHIDQGTHSDYDYNDCSLNNTDNDCSLNNTDNDISAAIQKVLHTRHTGMNVHTSKRYYYHWTNLEGWEGIKESMRIYPSQDMIKDAILGMGVYLNDVSPQNPKHLILENNYGTSYYDDDRADYFVKIPKDAVPTVQEKGTGRRVFKVRYGNRPLILEWIEDVTFGQHPST